MLRVRLLGELQADVDGAPVAPPASRRAWSLLAWLALHPGEHARGARRRPVLARRPRHERPRVAAQRAVGAAARARDATTPLVAGRERIALRARDRPRRVRGARRRRAAGGGRRAASRAAARRARRGLGPGGARRARASASAPPTPGSPRRRLRPPTRSRWARRRLAARPARRGRRARADAPAGRGRRPRRRARRLRPAVRPAARGARPRARRSRRARWPPAARGARRLRPPRAATAAAARRPRRRARRHSPRCGSACAAGVGAVAVIGGEGGIGKTRLAAELLARARAATRAPPRCAPSTAARRRSRRGSSCCAALARELEPPPADAAGRRSSAASRRRSRAASAAPAAAPADVPAELARARLFEAAVELAEYATADRPLVLLFDDVHVADAPTLELAAYLARRIVALPVLLVLTRRLTPAARRGRRAACSAARGRGVAGARARARSRSTARELEALVDAVSALDAPARERVIAAADGNPLLALETARAAASGDHGPPASLRGVVRAAIAAPRPPARRASPSSPPSPGRAGPRSRSPRSRAPRTCSPRWTAASSAASTAASASATTCCARPSLADLDDAAPRACTTRRSGARSRARPAEAARHLRLAGRDDLAAERLVEAAADAVRATALVARRPRSCARRSSCAPATPRIRLELATVLAQLGAASRRGRARAALAAARPADAPGARRHQRAALWFRGPLCDPGGAPRRRRGDARSTPAASTSRELRAELLLIRAWAEVTIDGSTRPSARSPSSRRSGSTSSARRCGATTCARSRLRADRRGAARRGRGGVRRLGRGRRGAGRPDLAYSGWANAACVAVALGDSERALALRRPRRGESPRRSRCSRSRCAGLRAGVLAPPRPPRGGARGERPPGASSPRGSARPTLVALADHDAGLLAALAGDHERAQELLGRALDGDPPVVRADARLRRAESLARCGRADEAEAEIRAAALEPVRAAHRPDGAGRAHGLRAGARRPRARRRGARRPAPAARPSATGAGSRATTRSRASTSPRWSTSAARRSPASSTRPASSSAWPRSCADWRPLPTFDDSTTTRRPGRGGVEAPLRPVALPRVVGRGRDASSRTAARAASRCTPRATRTSRCRRRCAPTRDGRRVTISCLVSYLVFEWRLEALERRHADRRPRRDPRGGGAPAGHPARRSERIPALTGCARGAARDATSSTRLNGVSAARRTRVKPPSCSTSASRFSPACAPSASPTSWLSDAGVQSIVEPRRTRARPG